jgi:hypothetical protein
MTDPTPFDTERSRLRRLGVVLERLPGEYKVNWQGGKEADWCYFEELGGAAARGAEMALERPLQPPVAGRRRRKGKPVYRSPKAYLKAMRKAHNRRLWATIGKIAPMK